MRQPLLFPLAPDYCVCILELIKSSSTRAERSVMWLAVARGSIPIRADCNPLSAADLRRSDATPLHLLCFQYVPYVSYTVSYHLYVHNPVWTLRSITTRARHGTICPKPSVSSCVRTLFCFTRTYGLVPPGSLLCLPATCSRSLQVGLSLKATPRFPGMPVTTTDF
jgi:hypothetical protein